MLASSRHAHIGQIQLHSLHTGERVRSVHAGRVGTVVKIYCDGSAAVCWDDGDPQPEGLAHERMPRALLEVIAQSDSARAERAPSVLQIVADALRAAALAPTLSDALDIAGAALTDIANLAHEEAPSERGGGCNEPLRTARNSADQTICELDRIASILEVIGRCARDVDTAIEDLACLGREMVEREAERIDTTFTALAHAASREVCHG